MIHFQTAPENYRHWRIEINGDTASLIMDVKEDGGLFEGYELKLNSYDLGVDIELYDAVQRLRLEHPEVKAVVIRSGKDKVFCAGANIRMLGGSSHAHKVNFCKFTNETRNSIEDASDYSGQKYICAINGTAAGGGYELALATDYLMLTDDGASTVSLPEVPLLAVLPGTGGLTRVTDKRKVRKDLADVFSTLEEGVKGQRAVDWRLVDKVVSNSRFEDAIAEQAKKFADASDRPSDAKGIELAPLNREISGDFIRYDHVQVEIDRAGRVATLTVRGPSDAAPKSTDELDALGDEFWPLACVRQLDDAILHLRFNEAEIGVITLKTDGASDLVLSYDAFLNANQDHWLVREIALYWKRTLKRVDLTSRTLVALVEPGSCFAGMLAELVFAADRAYMLDGEFEGDNRPPAKITLTQANFGPYPMSNGLGRLAARFLGEPETLDKARGLIGRELEAEQAAQAGLITELFDDIDWEDEIRILLEERASFSPDGLTGLEANLRFAGPETMESKIFGRLTAWQNWIFQRPNAVGPDGALKRYGTGVKPDYNQERV
jgi:benzoyl-CoA-dihydrodiol lyase